MHWHLAAAGGSSTHFHEEHVCDKNAKRNLPSAQMFEFRGFSRCFESMLRGIVGEGNNLGYYNESNI